MRLIRRLEANDSPSKNDGNGNGNDNDNGKGKAKASPPPPQKSQSPPPSRQSPPSSGAKKSPPSPSNGSGDSVEKQKSSELQPPPSGNDAHSLPSLPSSGVTPHSKSANVAGIIAGVIVGAGVLIILFICILVAWCRKRKKKQQQPYVKANYATYRPDHNNGGHHHGGKPGNQAGHGGWATPPPPAQPAISTGGTTATNPSAGSHQPLAPPPHPILALGINATHFTYDELAAATRGFSQANLLGQGGFGLVHKGVLPNGKEVAVKSLKAGSGQGEREFQAEVDIISRVHHRHLVSLVGYCIAGGQRMLVYEFLPNKTLEFHLHGKGQPVMDFAKRLKIALGSAKGLAYLHEDCNPRIIHRDIKGENILLDYAFEAKVADFGLAKLSDSNYSHVSTRVMGTFGYLAPEYASSGKLTDKSDVFSFGVMLLELITGRRPINPTRDEDNLVDWARPQFTRVLDEGVFEGFVDFRLENKFNPQEMTRMVACAAASIRHSAKRRPKMIQVVRALEGGMSLDALNGGVKPGESTYMGSSSSTEYDATTYHQDLQKFRKALESADFSSSSSGK